MSDPTPKNRPAKRPAPRRRQLSLDEYAQGVLQQDRSVLGRAITLVESKSARHRHTAGDLLIRLMPHTGRAIRLGITGVPGVGKSTFIDAFGTLLTGRGHRVAVLAVDPSSGVSGGSILGDKTRMHRLSVDPAAFVRPSPAAGTLGGVASKTRETMLLCEAAGFDVILVETVGVGQSETVVAEMTDFFMGLMLPGAGDELQGIKRGLLELLDLIAINKADGDNAQRAELAAQEHRNALHYTRSSQEGPEPEVICCSALTGKGLEEIWAATQKSFEELRESGRLQRRRADQMRRWMWAILEDELKRRLTAHEGVRAVLPSVEEEVGQGVLPPSRGAGRILQAFLGEAVEPGAEA